MNNKKYPHDHPSSSLTLQNLSLFKEDCEVFFETGTNTGKAIEIALQSGFKKIISIDIEQYYYELCAQKFKNNPEVVLHLGDSGKDLLKLTENVEEKILFWLDGHHYYDVPLINELKQIASLKRKDHVLLIDDVRMFNNPLWNKLSLQEVIDEIMVINKDYKISYADSPNGKNDILIAKV